MEGDINKTDSSKMQGNAREGGTGAFVLVVFFSFFITAASCVAVFFLTVRGAEKVLVPNVIGKSLTEALLVLQEKELYPKITLRYSDLPGDKGSVLDQSPASGSIVKAYRRVNLTVSRGIPIDYIGDYTGKQIDQVREELDLLFSGADSLVALSPVIYKSDSSVVGTILAQDPPAGTPIESKMNLRFVVSSGSEILKTQFPQDKNLSIKDFLSKIDGYKLIFDFSLEESEEAPAEGSVALRAVATGEAEEYSRVEAVLKIRPYSQEAENCQGLFSVELPDYPYPVPVRLDAQDQDGNLTSEASFSHTGKSLTLPYDVKKNSTLILYVLGEEYVRTVAE